MNSTYTADLEVEFDRDTDDIRALANSRNTQSDNWIPQNRYALALLCAAYLAECQAVGMSPEQAVGAIQACIKPPRPERLS